MKAAIKRGDLSFEKIVKMSSTEREDAFKNVLGANRTPAGGVEKVNNLAEKMNSMFVNKFRTDLTKEQLDFVLTQSTKINKARIDFDATNTIKTMEDFRNLKNAPEWAKEYVKLAGEISDIASPRNKMGFGESIKDFVREKIEYTKAGDDLFDKTGRGIASVADAITTPALKPLKAAWDASYFLRQGFKVMVFNPRGFAAANKEAFKSLKAAFGDPEVSKQIMLDFHARALVHPYRQQLVVTGKLAVGGAEEIFPVSIGEKFGGAFGNFFRGTNNAFTTFSQSARLELASDVYEKMLKDKGVTVLDDALLKDIGYVVNSITGRGSLGRLEGIAEPLNRIFFAPRYFKSSIDVFSMPFTAGTTEGRALARKSSIRTLSTLGGILATASIFSDDVELDPWSNNFGTMGIPGSNKARIDLTAGIGSYVRTAVQTVTGRRTNSKGKTVIFADESTFKADTRLGTVAKFGIGKLSPAPSMLNQLFSEKKFYSGARPSFSSPEESLKTSIHIARELLIPIGANNMPEYLQNEEFVTALIMFVSEFGGLNIKTPKY